MFSLFAKIKNIKSGLAIKKLEACLLLLLLIPIITKNSKNRQELPGITRNCQELPVWDK